MMDNERRADLGAMAVTAAAEVTNVARVDSTDAAVIDVLAYIAHFCDRCGLVPEEAFARGLRSYQGDSEDGPPARHTLDHTRALMEVTT